MLDADGALWITDFGLARIETDPTFSATGEVLGTLRYMSPGAGARQAGRRRSSERHLFAGRHAVRTLDADARSSPMSPTMVVLAKIASEDPPPPRQLNPSIPVDLETIVLKAMSKEPGERYPTAEEFAADLERFCERRKIKAQRRGLADRLARWLRRHPAGLGVAVHGDDRALGHGRRLCHVLGRAAEDRARTGRKQCPAGDRQYRNGQRPPRVQRGRRTGRPGASGVAAASLRPGHRACGPDHCGTRRQPGLQPSGPSCSPQRRERFARLRMVLAAGRLERNGTHLSCFAKAPLRRRCTPRMGCARSPASWCRCTPNGRPARGTRSGRTRRGRPRWRTRSASPRPSTSSRRSPRSRPTWKSRSRWTG